VAAAEAAEAAAEGGLRRDASRAPASADVSFFYKKKLFLIIY
jgi:hypothetical protein